MIQRTSIFSIPFYLDIINKCNKFYINSIDDLEIFDYGNLPINYVNFKFNSNLDIKIII